MGLGCREDTGNIDEGNEYYHYKRDRVAMKIGYFE